MGNYIPLLSNVDYADPVWVNVPGYLLGDAQLNAVCINVPLSFTDLTLAGICRIRNQLHIFSNVSQRISNSVVSGKSRCSMVPEILAINSLKSIRLHKHIPRLPRHTTSIPPMQRSNKWSSLPTGRHSTDMEFQIHHDPAS